MLKLSINKIIASLEKFYNFLTSKEFLRFLPFIILILILFLTNTFHESYPDEFDNILGGWYIIHGKLPYTGFFTHHGPFPYFLAAFVTVFTGQSFVAFRIMYAILLTVYVAWSFFFLRKRLGEKETAFYPFFILAFSIFSTYYWSHMLLADNVAALLFVPVYTLLFIKSIYKKPFILADFTFISILSSLALYSSLSYVYLYIIIVSFSLYMYLKQFPLNLKSIFYAFLKPITIILMPHVVYLIYLILTGSLYDYLYQNFKFNTEFYIYNYPRTPGTTFINPVRFAIVIAHSFFGSFHTLLTGIRDSNFAFPVNMTMALANVSVMTYALFKKRYVLALWILLIIIYANARSNVLDSKETDYQSAVYIFISFLNLLVILPLLFRDLNEKIGDAKKVVFGLLLGVLGVYSFFCLLFLVHKFDDKVYPKYMGKAPLIYDRPRIAPLVNLVTDSNDYAWIGPFEFEELFYMNAQIPSKHHILIRGVGQSGKLLDAMVEDFNRNKPKVIYFDKNFYYLGAETKSFSGKFISFLDENYITLLDHSDGGRLYKSVAAIDLKVDLETKLYIRKDKVNEVIPILLQNNYIH